MKTFGMKFVSNESSSFAFGNFVSLCCSLYIGIAFFLLPWLTIIGSNVTTAFELLGEGQSSFEITSQSILEIGTSGLIVIPIVAFISGLTSLWGMANPNHSKETSILSAIAGVIGLIYLGIFFIEVENNQIPTDFTNIIDAGFWVVLIAMFFLVMQIFIRLNTVDYLRLARNLSIVILFFAILVSGYLSYLKVGDHQAVCAVGGTFDCGTVLNSIYSEVAGIPIAILGLVTNLIVLSVLGLEDRFEILHDYGITFVFGVVLFAFLFSIYLIYVQSVLIEAFCPWCLSHEALITILFALSVWRFCQSLNLSESMELAED